MGQPGYQAQAHVKDMCLYEYMCAVWSVILGSAASGGTHFGETTWESDSMSYAQQMLPFIHGVHAGGPFPDNVSPQSSKGLRLLGQFDHEVSPTHKGT